ncbi:NAD(P)-dependent oxidoreductase [bacterium]|nr:NAD(P)-dependent oxidoreductase [candidate division CSSED10-310 bacterium]
MKGLVLTGASGFLGRHLLDALKSNYRIYAIARRSQNRCNAPLHANIRWYQVDIAHTENLQNVFRAIRRDGGAETVIHLAAHYDFTGEDHPEYFRTNVNGLRNILEEVRILRPRCFIFASSLAACEFPPSGKSLTEETPPDGRHIYAVTKAIGEKLVKEFGEKIPSFIVRLPALFSDWCEYPPLFIFIRTWLSQAWNRNILGGKGKSAIPYLHVRDAVSFLERLMAISETLASGSIFIAGGDETISHLDLFKSVTSNYLGEPRKPLHMPRFLCGPGMWFREIIGSLRGEKPFERTWMAHYIDKDMRVDASWTRKKLNWEPRKRLTLLRRIPFLIEYYKSDPLEWFAKNRAAMKQPYVHPNLQLYYLLEKYENRIDAMIRESIFNDQMLNEFANYRKLGEAEQYWAPKRALRELMSSVRTLDKGVFMAYCRDLAKIRSSLEFTAREICEALMILNNCAIKVLDQDPDFKALGPDIRNYITMTIQFGVDAIQEVYEKSGAADIDFP